MTHFYRSCAPRGGSGLIMRTRAKNPPVEGEVRHVTGCERHEDGRAGRDIAEDVRADKPRCEYLSLSQGCVLPQRRITRRRLSTEYNDGWLNHVVSRLRRRPSSAELVVEAFLLAVVAAAVVVHMRNMVTDFKVYMADPGVLVVDEREEHRRREKNQDGSGTSSPVYDSPAEPALTPAHQASSTSPRGSR